jgi:acyl-CoA reductase-like NAD-dependent aldehyde dehydrogenase
MQTYNIKPKRQQPSENSVVPHLTDFLASCHLLFSRPFPTNRGVLNIVHGTHDVVNNILDHPDIAAVSFVGGDAAGRYIYGRAAANGKRVQVWR